MPDMRAQMKEAATWQAPDALFSVLLASALRL
jgi:hypothetical protein